MQGKLFELASPSLRGKARPAGEYLLVCRGFWGDSRPEGNDRRLFRSRVDCSFACVFCPSGHSIPDQRVPGADASFVLQVRRGPKTPSPKAEKPVRGIGGVVGNSTDPYQQYSLCFQTRRILRELVQGHGLSVTIVTRSPLAASDIPRFRAIACRNDLKLVVPLLSLEDGLLRVFEPGAPSAGERLRLLEELAAAGLPALLSIGPIVPALTDSLETLESLVLEARRRGAGGISFSIPVLDEFSREVFFSAVRAVGAHPERLCRNLFGDGFHPPESYRRMVATRLKALKEKHGFEERPAAAAGALGDSGKGQQLRLL